MPAWLDLSTFKSRIGVTTSANDALYTAILDGVEATVSNVIGGPVLNTTYTDYLSTMGSDRLFIPRRPVVSITSLYLDTNNGNYGQTSGGFPDGTLLVAGVDYVLEIDSPNGISRAGTVLRLYAAWPANWYRVPERLGNSLWPIRGTVKAVYVAGWGADSASLPESIVQAGYLEAAAQSRVTRTGAAGVVTGGSLIGVSYSLGQTQTGSFGNRIPLTLSPAALALLTPYRDLSAGIGSGL